jgi:hypothetical protein
MYEVMNCCWKSFENLDIKEFRVFCVKFQGKFRVGAWREHHSNQHWKLDVLLYLAYYKSLERHEWWMKSHRERLDKNFFTQKDCFSSISLNGHKSELRWFCGCQGKTSDLLLSRIRQNFWAIELLSLTKQTREGLCAPISRLLQSLSLKLGDLIELLV